MKNVGIGNNHFWEYLYRIFGTVCFQSRQPLTDDLCGLLALSATSIFLRSFYRSHCHKSCVAVLQQSLLFGGSVCLESLFFFESASIVTCVEPICLLNQFFSVASVLSPRFLSASVSVSLSLNVCVSFRFFLLLIASQFNSNNMPSQCLYSPPQT